MSATQPAIVARDAELEGRVHVDEFSLQAGKCIVLCGPNGSGKSSLLRLLAGLETPDRGLVSLRGEPLSNLSRLEVASSIAWLPQRPQLGEPIACEAIVAMARFRFSESEGEALRRGREILVEHGLGHLVGRLSTRISGGELQRVLLTTLVAQEVPFLLVDEPANHLDPSHQVATYRRLGRLFAEGKGVLIVSHDVRLARLLGHPNDVEVFCMKEGGIVSRSRLSDLDLVHTLEEVYGVPFVAQDQPGALSIDLARAMDPQ